MIPISICMIGKNEEKHLGECLQRLAPLNCELVFVDTGSTDNTVAIASKFTSNIHYFNWIDDFSAARNFALSKASHDWILSIDCDEYLEDSEDVGKLLPAFCKTLAGRTESIGTITINNRYILNNESTITKGVVARFFCKAFAQFNGAVHEQILPYCGGLAPRFTTPFHFLHVGYYGEDTIKRKAKRNLALLHSDLNKKGPTPYLYYQIGQSYYSMADYEHALEYFNLGLSMDVNPEYDYVQLMVESYGYTLLNLNMLQTALGLEGIYDSFCQHADFVFLMGLIYMKTGLFDKAVKEFLKASAFSDSSVRGVNSYMAYYNIGVIYECTGHRKEAVEYYKKCGNYVPANNRLHVLLQ